MVDLVVMVVLEALQRMQVQMERTQSAYHWILQAKDREALAVVLAVVEAEEADMVGSVVEVDIVQKITNLLRMLDPVAAEEAGMGQMAVMVEVVATSIKLLVEQAEEVDMVDEVVMVEMQDLVMIISQPNIQEVAEEAAVEDMVLAELVDMEVLVGIKQQAPPMEQMETSVEMVGMALVVEAEGRMDILHNLDNRLQHMVMVEQAEME